MKRIIILALAISATTVYASCQTTNIITPDGRFTTCYVCCDQNGQNCTWNCS